MFPGNLSDSGARLERALESLDDVIELLKWRYAEDADPRLVCLRDELRLALALAGCDARLMH